MFGPNGEKLDFGSDGSEREKQLKRTAYQIPGVSPPVPPDVIAKIVKSGSGATARRLGASRRHIIDPDNRVSK